MSVAVPARPPRFASHAGLIVAAVVPVLYGGDADPGRLPDVRTHVRRLASATTPCDGRFTLRFIVPADRPEQWTVELTSPDADTDAGPDASAIANATASMTAIASAGHDASTPEPSTGRLAVYALPPGAVATGAVPAASTSGERLAIVTADGVVDDLPPMLGRHDLDPRRGVVRFVPRYPPVAGVTYVARAAGAPDARFALPEARHTPTTRVAAIYPSTLSVPANLLRLHIEFSAPMSDGEAQRRLRLLDARGREVIGAFLHVDEELWDASRRRLTVLFDPGRIKRGLRANLEEGAPLEEGRTFRLAIDGDWRDGQGVPLAAGLEKRLVVDAADRTSPDWRRWQLQPPIAGSMQPLVVRFDEPLDRVLLERWLVVTDADGQRIAGQAIVGEEESSWSFLPTHPWSARPHQVLVDPRIEDRAANSLRSLFDVDLSTRPAGANASHASHASQGSQASHPSAPAAEPIVLPFTPAAGS